MLLLKAVLLCALLPLTVFADETIYSDGAISSTWQDWSWGSTIDYSAADIFEGTSSISVNATAYSALSFYDTSIFASSYAGLKFDLAVSESPLYHCIQPDQ